MIADELKKLNQLKEDGIISKAEFNRAKEKLLNHDKKKASTPGVIFGLNENIWCTLMHLSILAGFIVPLLGLVLPIVLWVVSKDDSEMADLTGRHLINWVASFVIYFIVSVVLTSIVIGWLLLSALVIVSVIFVIIGAIKATNNEIWNYPLSIPFLSVEKK